jgi:hypothetical protein
LRRYFDVVVDESDVCFARSNKKYPGNHTLKWTHPEVEFLSTSNLYREFESFYELFLFRLCHFSNYNQIDFLYISKAIPEVKKLDDFPSLPKRNTTNTDGSLVREQNQLGLNPFETYDFLHVCHDINIQNQIKEA